MDNKGLLPRITRGIINQNRDLPFILKKKEFTINGQFFIRLNKNKILLNSRKIQRFSINKSREIKKKKKSIRTTSLNKNETLIRSEIYFTERVSIKKNKKKHSNNLRIG